MRTFFCSPVQTWLVPRGPRRGRKAPRAAGGSEGLGAWEEARGPSRPRVPAAGGGVLVIESLLDADGRGPLTTQLYSLNMLVQTEGRERTPAQYLALLGAAGFRGAQCRRTGGLYDAVLAWR